MLPAVAEVLPAAAAVAGGTAALPSASGAVGARSFGAPRAPSSAAAGASPREVASLQLLGWQPTHRTGHILKEEKENTNILNTRGSQPGGISSQGGISVFQKGGG